MTCVDQPALVSITDFTMTTLPPFTSFPVCSPTTIILPCTAAARLLYRTYHTTLPIATTATTQTTLTRAGLETLEKSSLDLAFSFTSRHTLQHSVVGSSGGTYSPSHSTPKVSAQSMISERTPRYPYTHEVDTAPRIIDSPTLVQ